MWLKNYAHFALIGTPSTENPGTVPYVHSCPSCSATDCLTRCDAGDGQAEGAYEVILVDIFVHDLESNQRQIWVTDDKLEYLVPDWVEACAGTNKDKESGTLRLVWKYL